MAGTSDIEDCVVTLPSLRLQSISSMQLSDFILIRKILFRPLLSLALLKKSLVRNGAGCEGPKLFERKEIFCEYLRTHDPAPFTSISCWA
jgi:hypothetical protein